MGCFILRSTFLFPYLFFRNSAKRSKRHEYLVSATGMDEIVLKVKIKDGRISAIDDELATGNVNGGCVASIDQYGKV